MTAEDKEKYVIPAIVSAVCTLIVGFILMSFTGYFDSKAKTDKRIDAKLDKTEYLEKCKTFDSKLDKKVDNNMFLQYISNQKDMNELLLDEIRMNRVAIKETR